MTPLVPLAGGALALLAAALLLRSYGSRYRIARLLATVPEVSLADAIAAGEAGRPVYVRVAGRLDSLRSKGNVDVRAVASRWDGGGHRNAAGCTVNGSLDDIKGAVVTEMKRVIDASPPAA